MWNAIEEAIIEAANKQIPKKKIFNTKSNRRYRQKKSQQCRHIMALQQIIKKAKTRRSQMIEEEEKEEINNKLKDIGKEIGVLLPKLHKQWSEAWLDDIKGWQRILKDRRKEEWEQAQRKQIEENINKRCEMIKTDQGRMIASLLNKPYKKITLDRFIIQNDEEASLITEPEAVLNGLTKHFGNQFRKRKTKLEEMSEEWKEIYSPKAWIKESWYEKLKEKIEEEEWEDNLRELKANTAPGISGISYTLIK
jgi:hypothetical protein